MKVLCVWKFEVKFNWSLSSTSLNNSKQTIHLHQFSRGTTTYDLKVDVVLAMFLSLKNTLEVFKVLWKKGIKFLFWSSIFNDFLNYSSKKLWADLKLFLQTFCNLTLNTIFLQKNLSYILKFKTFASTRKWSGSGSVRHNKTIKIIGISFTAHSYYFSSVSI